MIRTGLDRLLEDPSRLTLRRYGLLTHLAAVSSDWAPAHLALARAGHPPRRLFGPEHGLYAQAQDMEPTRDAVDPWTGAEIVSLYGEEAASLRPSASAFDDLDLLIVDLQDVGARYYTFAATAVWAAAAAIEGGCAVWVLDRPNPLGGEVVEGNVRAPDLESFVGAFPHPVRHGLTIGELVWMELDRSGLAAELEVWPMSGWRRDLLWADLGRPWVAPSPNMPAVETTALYPGACLVEATALSEGRGTTRPFQLLGAPRIDPPTLAAALERLELDGVRFAPTRFRPEFQKHAGVDCGGVELVVTDARRLRPFRMGVELLLELGGQPGFEWRAEAYEFVTDRPAIDLLTGSPALREAMASGTRPDAWLDSWEAEETAFRRAREPFLLYH